ncbi:MAG: phage minor head protein [Candidatus Thorarchaeota archaeon]
MTQWYPNRKEIEVPSVVWDDIYKDDKFERDVLMTMTGASQDGVTLASELIPLGIDYTAVNTVAMNWAATYSGQLIKGLEKTTLKAIKAAIAAFIRTPGMTIGDVMSLLPFGESRALRIAVTEITRAYGQAEELVGIQLEKEFPDVEVVKTWYTNNDDLVCNICAPLDGMTVLRQEGFTTEKDKSLGIPSPPAHVNCRCWMSTTTRIT